MCLHILKLVTCYAFVHFFTYSYSSVLVCFICLSMYLHINIYLYTYIYTYTYIYIHIYTYILVCNPTAGASVGATQLRRQHHYDPKHIAESYHRNKLRPKNDHNIKRSSRKVVRRRPTLDALAELHSGTQCALEYRFVPPCVMLRTPCCFTSFRAFKA